MFGIFSSLLNKALNIQGLNINQPIKKRDQSRIFTLKQWINLEYFIPTVTQLWNNIATVLLAVENGSNNG